jgi:hypothetical protein
MKAATPSELISVAQVSTLLPTPPEPWIRMTAGSRSEPGAIGASVPLLCDPAKVR